MSKNRTQPTTLEITCPACQGKGAFPTWECIDGTSDDALRQRVLTDDQLFFYHCPHCHAAVHIEAPCLYINRHAKWMVWHLPDLRDQITSAEVTAFLGQPSFAKFTCRVSRTWGEWREKIIELESDYDDRLYEIIKYGAYSLVKKEDQERLPLEAYHIDYTDGQADEKNNLSLLFLRSDKKGQGYGYVITPAVKEMTRDLFQPILERLPGVNDTGRFERFDYTWARELVRHVFAAAASPEGKKAYGPLLTLWLQTLSQELFHQPLQVKTDTGT